MFSVEFVGFLGLVGCRPSIVAMVNGCGTRHWIAQEDICRAYRVGPATLNRYSRRGLLPFRTGEGGALWYDGEFVARMFRARLDASPSAARARVGGALGRVYLGEDPVMADELSKRHAA